MVSEPEQAGVQLPRIACPCCGILPVRKIARISWGCLLTPFT